MLGDSITLADATPVNQVYTKIGDDKVSSDFSNMAVTAGIKNDLLVRQTLDKSGKRRTVVRLDYVAAATEAVPNPTKSSVYCVFESTAKEANTQTVMTHLIAEMKNFLASSDAPKILRGEV